MLKESIKNLIIKREQYLDDPTPANLDMVEKIEGALIEALIDYFKQKEMK